jgi:transposase
VCHSGVSSGRLSSLGSCAQSELGGTEVVGVEQWAEIRRLHFVKGLSQREIHRRTGLHRDTIRRAVNGTEPPVYRRAAAGSKLDPFKDEIHRLLRDDHKLTGVRVRELLEPLGCTASKTVVDDYLREVRPLFAPRPRTFQRIVYRPGELCQFDLWEPREEVPVGHGQSRRGWVVIACLGYSRAGAGVLVFSKQTEDLLAGIAGCLERLGGLPRVLVWDRQAGIHGHGDRPTEAFAAFCGQLRVGWHFCEPADPQAKGVVERVQGYAETNFEPGRVFANELHFQDRLDAWFVKVNARTHKTLRARPVDRLVDELAVMAPLPAEMPDCARRWTMRVPPDPHLRLDTNDYSLDPALVGRRVEVIADQRTVTAVCLDTGELACRHPRTFARHRTVTALEHARALRAGRQGVSAETPVEVRPLARYDALIA